MKLLTPLLPVLLLIACSASPSENDVQTAIAQTVEAAPTATPTETPKPTATPTPEPSPSATPLPEAFLTHLNQFLQDGSRVTGATAQGVTYVDFVRRVGDARASHDLLISFWGDLVPTQAQDEFRDAFYAWDDAAYIWDLKINNYDTPTEPDINGYSELVGYWGNDLLQDVRPDDYLVRDYRGKQYLPFDENISILLTLAAGHFNSGASQLQQYLN